MSFDTDMHTFPFKNSEIMILCSVAALGSFNFGYSLGILNTTIDLIVQSLRWCENTTDLDCEQRVKMESVLLPSVFLGAAFGAMSCGQLLSYGRRTLLLLSNIAFFIGPFCVSVTPEGGWGFYLFLFGRCITGLGVGLSSIAVPTYINEFSPSSERGSLGCLHQLMITIGILCSILFGVPQTQPDRTSPVDPDDFNKSYWRWMSSVGAFIAVIQSIWLLLIKKREPACFIVESMSISELEFEDNNCSKNAYESLTYVYDDEYAVKILASLKASKLSSINSTLSNNESVQDSFISSWDLLTSIEHWRPLCAALFLSIFQQLSFINVIVTKSNSMLSEAGISPSNLTYASIVLQLINVFCTLFAKGMIDRIGRVRLLMIGGGLQALFLSPIALEPILFKNESHLNPIVTLISLGGFIAAFAIGLGPVVWVYIAEVFSLNAKNAGVSISTAANWATTLLVIYAATLMSNSYVFILSFISSILVVLAGKYFLKETAGASSSPYYTSRVYKPGNSGSPMQALPADNIILNQVADNSSNSIAEHPTFLTASISPLLHTQR